MIGREPEQHLPQPVALSDRADRLAEVAFCLGDPERAAVLDALCRSEGPATAADLAARAGLAEDAADSHLRLLVDHGLARTTRAGVLRRKAYETDIADVEIRFRGAGKARGASARTAKTLAKDAKKRARQAKRQAREAAKVAKKRTDLRD